MNRSAKFASLLFCILCISMLSCKKDKIDRFAGTTTFPRTEQEKEKAALHSEFANMLRHIYQDEQAFREVQAAIWSGYYEDERVLLKALLAPGSSPLYTLDAFKKFNTAKGRFQQQFDRFINKDSFPLLTRYLDKAGYKTGSNWPSQEKPSLMRVNALVNIDPETGGEEEAPAIYFPYSENYRPVFQNNEETWVRTTLVAADRDANEGPGLEPLNCGSYNCYIPVLVNDDYCEQRAVHIVQSGGRVATTAPPVASPTVSMVMIGKVMCSKQYDHLISFTGNGGGSELRFVRADGYLQHNSNGQITSPQNVISVNCSRKEIRKKRWKEVNSIWDSNWEADNPEQVFAIYEEDNEGSRTLSGSIQAKLKSLTIEPLNYEFTVKTKDDIIRQLGWKRNSFFAFNQGGLNNGCGLSDGFTIYDCKTSVAYTMPARK
ncbi:hypothetical protein [Pseudoflavitalea rhizosphaerae]|uniref:hypothetical protein n=1 Tax=Pseudoflavitalea rhizosphaerae TaxID=1884793 RepID=UPI000F8DD8ED|nr:hypothetical protein [Pseudoflavitalea rhizosphaerae]